MSAFTHSAMLRAAILALPLAACVWALPAKAQSVDNPTGMNNPNSLQPKGREPENAPQALPGIGAPVPQTAPNLSAPSSTDPTTALFSAINANDYNGAQDAVSRGADINQENAFGETPLDLSVALSRNSITFMLLSARNEDGQGPSGGVMQAGAAAAAQAAGTAPSAHGPRRGHRLHPIPAYQPAPPAKRGVSKRGVSTPGASTPVVSTPGSDPGTPNASAGFLGFGPKE